MTDTATHRPDPLSHKLWQRIPTGPRGFPIVAASGCGGDIIVDGRSVYCRTCGRGLAWRQVAHSATDDRDYLRERMSLELDYITEDDGGDGEDACFNVRDS